MIPLIILFFRKPDSGFTKEFQAVKPYLWLMFIGAFYELVFTKLLKIPSAYWFTAYGFLEFLALFYFFKKLFIDRYRFFFIVFFLITFFCFLTILKYWEMNISQKLDGYFSVPVSLFVFSSSFLWFKELFEKPDIQSLFKIPSFYFISGLILYFAGAVFVSLLIYEIGVVTHLARTYWMVFVVMAIIMHIMMVIGVWVGTEKKP